MEKETELELGELVVERIKRLCQTKNESNNKKITSYRIAKNGKLNPGTLNNILSGVRKDLQASSIQKICKGLDMSVRDFFDDDLFN